MLQSAGFTEAIVIVPDSARQEVSNIPSLYNLSIKLDIVGIPGPEVNKVAKPANLVGRKLFGSLCLTENISWKSHIIVAILMLIYLSFLAFFRNVCQILYFCTLHIFSLSVIHTVKFM